MDSMSVDVSFVKNKVFKVFNVLSLPAKYAGIVYILSQYGHAYAFDLTVMPRVTAQEIYSNNIKLSPAGTEKSGFISELDPGVSIIGRSARSTLNLNYQMQNLYNAQGNNSLNTFNQLQYNSHNTVISNRLFLDSRSSISQQNTSNTQIANDNIAGSGNKTNVSTFGMSPYWTPRFGNYANGNMRLNFDTVTTGSSANITANSTLIPISDSVSIAEIVQINSGTEFKRINWNLSYNNSENYRVGSDNVRLQNSTAAVRTYLNQYFNVFAQGGYSRNSFDTTTTNLTHTNGFAYTFGGQWKPSKYYSIEVGGGNNSYVTLNMSPMQRLSWNTTFRNNSIGLNSGKTWQTALNYRTSRSTWALTHDNTTTTVQEILSKLQVFPIQDSSGNTIINQNTNQPLTYAINLPTLTNEVIVSKTWNLSASFNTGKSTVGISAFNSDRVYQLSGISEKVSGLSGTWSWQFASRTSAYIHPLWQQTTSNGTAYTKSDRYDLSIGINRSITNRINGKLELHHVNQISDINTNDYQENRATATLFMRY